MTHPAETRRRALELMARPDLLLDDIAAETGVNRRTLYRWALAANLPPRSRGHRSIYTAADRDRAVEMYTRGDPMAQISAAIGASSHAIRQWVLAAGHPLRRTHTNARIDTREAVSLQATYGTREAAEILECSMGTIRYHMRRAEVLAIRAKIRGRSD